MASSDKVVSSDQVVSSDKVVSSDQLVSSPEVASPSDSARVESHNSQINTAAAQAHRCGMTHLATGRICLLPERHPGSCDFQQRQNDVLLPDTGS